MNEDQIAEVGIDEAGSLYVRPVTKAFPYIYREAMEVGWDPANRRLFGPKPREWSYADWFRQITRAAREQSTVLRITPATVWTNVSEQLRREIEAVG